MTPNKPDLDRIEGLARAATPGEWTYGAQWICRKLPDFSYTHLAQVPLNDYDSPRWNADAEYIVAVRPDTILSLISYYARELEETGWQDISIAPKNMKVLVAYQNKLGNWRIVTACYHTHLPWSDDHEPRDSDGEYAPEGWYEESDSNETIYRTDGLPTHWRPLPTPPALSRTQK